MIAKLMTEQGLAAIAFAGCIVMTLAGAVMATATRRLMRGVLGLAVCFLGLAGLIYFLNSPFVSLMVILIYVGAICVVIVFGIMLAGSGVNLPSAPRLSLMVMTGFAASGGLCWVLVKTVRTTRWADPQQHPGAGTIQDIGRAFLTSQAMAFEVISLVLLVAIIGAIVVARGGRAKS